MSRGKLPRIIFSTPIALDAEYSTWNAFHNRYWPAEYLFDRQGRLRKTHFGEGSYEEDEVFIEACLKKTARRCRQQRQPL
jgi:hypothetical protein